jgi:hypothetical protein
MITSKKAKSDLIETEFIEIMNVRAVSANPANV